MLGGFRLIKRPSGRSFPWRVEKSLNLLFPSLNKSLRPVVRVRHGIQRPRAEWMGAARDGGGGYVSDPTYDWFSGDGMGSNPEVSLLPPLALDNVWCSSAPPQDWGLVVVMPPDASGYQDSMEADYTLSGGTFTSDTSSPGDFSFEDSNNTAPSTIIVPQLASAPASTSQTTFTTTYAYDPITHQVSTITTPYGTIHYAYDDATGLLIQTWTGADDILYGYNSQGQLTSVTEAELNGAAPAAGTNYDANGNVIPGEDGTSRTILYGYDNAGNLLWESDPNGMTTAYSYDNLNRLTGETVTVPELNKNHELVTTVLFSQTNTINDNGTIAKTVEEQWQPGGTTWIINTNTYSYDAMGRLSGETLSSTAVNTSYTDSYSYDLNSNRITEAIDGGHTVSGGETITYKYDGNDQMIQETGAGTGSAGNYTIWYTYDSAGNLATEVHSSGEFDQYSYDVRNLMVQSIQYSPSGQVPTVTDYAYDADGALALQEENADPGVDAARENGSLQNTVFATNTININDPHNPTGSDKAIQQSVYVSYYGKNTIDDNAVESESGSYTRAYVLGLTVEAQNDLMGSYSAGATAIPIPGEYTGTLYLLTDGHGSTRAVVSGSGAIEQTYDYGDFGSALDFDPSAALTTWLYGNGGYYDTANSFTEDGARWLNGFWFTQADYGSQMAIGGYGNNLDPITLNNYLFGGADPVMMSDPTGHFGLDDVLTAIGVGSALIAQQLPAITLALEYTSLTALAVSALSSPLAYYEQQGELPTGTFFEGVRDYSFYTAEISSLVWFFAASGTPFQPVPPAGQASEAELEGEAAQAANRLGFNLSDVNINNGVAQIPINFTQTISGQDVSVVRQYLQSQGATTAVINTGPVINPQLIRALQNSQLIGRLLNGIAQVQDMGNTDPIIPDAPVYEITLTLPKK
jgi:YD repeat-containing protein